MARNRTAAKPAAAVKVSGGNDPLTLLTLAKTQLILSSKPTAAFLSHLLLRLECSVAPVGTAATDGRRLLIDAAFWVALSAAERMGVLAHEVLHCAYGHQWRRESREPRRWNIAADLAINHLLIEGGFTLPSDRLLAGEGPFRGLEKGQSAEWYYANLPRGAGAGGDKGAGDGGDSSGQPGGQGEPQNGQGDGEQQGGNGQGVPDDGGCGAVIDVPTGSDGSDVARAEEEARWRVAIAQAAQAVGRGSLPGGLRELVDAATEVQTRWQDVLREWVQRHLPNDYSWSRPNRRHVGRGIYLPSLHADALGTIVVCDDTSGSISNATRAVFLGHLRAICECSPAKIIILRHHSKVYEEREWVAEDGDLTLDGGRSGGTSHKPCFARIAEMEDDVVGVICLTDCETEYPERPCEYPTLWCVEHEPHTSYLPPFGQMLRLE